MFSGELTMNTLTIAGICIGLLFLGYRFYGRRIEKLYGIDPARKTPAETNYDGVDYVPAKHWFVLFGHHFAAIAGAAPGDVRPRACGEKASPGHPPVPRYSAGALFA